MCFGKWTVVELSRKGKHTYWRCLCECGKEAIVEDGNLTHGRTKSCGCRMRTQIIAGTRFHRLTAVEEMQSPARERKNAILWRCRCDCGREAIVRAYDLQNGSRKSCGCLKRRRLTLLEKIQRHVHLTENGCWLWGPDKDRYGYTYVNRKRFLTHRVVYECFHGPIPEGMFVCHNCPGGDNRACCNPEHLWLGSCAENLHDAVEKGRTRQGERHWNCKLTAEEAREIFRRFHVNGETQTSLARFFSLRLGTIRDVVWRKTWRKATEELGRELGIP